MKKAVIVILALALSVSLTVLAGCSSDDSQAPSDGDETSGYMDVNADEAAELIDENPDLIIIDVSPNYDQGHIPGAVNYYIGDGSLEEAIPTLDKNADYLVYCHVDSASISGAQMLIDAGFENVYRLEGNYQAWVDAGYAVEGSEDDISQNPATKQGSLVDVTGGAVTGTAYILRENGMIMHEVIAVLPDPESGAFYEGWLVSSGPQGGVISTGKMVKQSDGSWMLAFAADDEYEGYDFVVITLEKVEDANPEVHILEGTVQ
jgi:rhodanese-related sulfurtransferase